MEEDVHTSKAKLNPLPEEVAHSSNNKPKKLLKLKNNQKKLNNQLSNQLNKPLKPNAHSSKETHIIHSTLMPIQSTEEDNTTDTPSPLDKPTPPIVHSLLPDAQLSLPNVHILEEVDHQWTPDAHIWLPNAHGLLKDVHMPLNMLKVNKKDKPNQKPAEELLEAELFTHTQLTLVDFGDQELLEAILSDGLTHLLLEELLDRALFKLNKTKALNRSNATIFLIDWYMIS